MTTVDLGMPSPRKDEVPLSVATRRSSRQIMVGTVPVGGAAPVSVQSMTTPSHADVAAPWPPLAQRTAAGGEIGR
ncbi:4-hydroxy-3-methylbut-2-en-1-yl diphosphate synthase, partial [Streptomyces sp. NPDC127079]